MQSRNILCVDDSETCHLYDVLFSQINRRLHLTSAANMAEAVDLVKSKRFDLYILEPYTRELNGIELCRMIRRNGDRSPVVFYSGMSREVDRSLAMAAGADAYLVKGADFEKFIEIVKSYLS